MIEIIVVCEGQTEETFVNRILGPSLWSRNIFLHPRLIRTSRYSKGGALNGSRVLLYLRNTLRERQNIYVTTLFDLYGLPSDFPGQQAAATNTDPLDRAVAVEAQLHSEAIQMAQCRDERFLPHIQPYEFEAFVFSDTERFAEVEPAWQTYLPRLAAIRNSAGGPEYINDGPETHPAARLQHLLRPRYNKLRHGIALCDLVGLDRIRAQCSHFDRWLTRMETLPQL